ncbi:hypothetical protein ACXR2T_10055 [Leucobacter sp. HY1910]
MSNINRHSAGAKQAGQSVGGQFAASQKTEASGTGLELGAHLASLAAEQSAHERDWNAAEDRLKAYRGGDESKTVVSWVDASLAEDGAVRRADWHRATHAAWLSGHRTQLTVSQDYPHLKRYLDTGQGHRSPDLTADCKAYAAESKRAKKQGELSALCERYAKHGSKEHERDQSTALRADRLNTEAAAGKGLTDERLLRGKHLAEDTFGAATRGELSDNTHDNLLTLADTLEDQNFHAESIAYEAIARIHDARRNPEQKITGTAAWVILSARLDVPEDIRARARRDDPNSAESGEKYRQHSREPFV